MNLHDELYDATTFTDTVDGIRLANELIDRMIAVLQKTPGIPARSHHEWELLFAEARARAEQDFDDRLTGLVNLDKAIEDIVDHLSELHDKENSK